MSMSISSTVASLLWFLVFVPSASGDEVIQLNATEFYEMAMAGYFEVIVDTRESSEWEAGHVENATFLENLQFANTSTEIATTADLNGCKECPIVVYCQSGRRAAGALEKLALAGFQGPLYNGLGVQQWTAEGYPLVNTASVDPECKNEEMETCAKSAVEEEAEKETVTTTAETNAPSSNETLETADDAGTTAPPTEAAGSSSEATDAPSSAAIGLRQEPWPIVSTAILVVGMLTASL
ncbi:Rhodanese domain protein [Seminavis robusta]|uniref:Rhodanese domain protein n=1 Tax=Seminavis robusta TaxID=568900 RepID=A0A9N8E7C5_9STRA|nr:Rhodanese domain protein [Seminavis robusta]|eukprot:Sro699_g189430.1 Rhodanese domain protein (238) ;mRNA; r:19304-20017